MMSTRGEKSILIGQTLIVLAFFDVAAGIDISADRQSDEWTAL